MALTKPNQILERNGKWRRLLDFGGKKIAAHNGKVECAISNKVE